MKKIAVIGLGVAGIMLVGCSSVGVGAGVSMGAYTSPQSITPSQSGFDVAQFGQSAKRSGAGTIHAIKFGIDFKRGADGIAYINGKPASNDENTTQASAYSAGLLTVIVYANGKINAMEDGKYLGRMR